MLNPQDRSAIDGLFQRLQDAERQSGARDAEAEALIRERIARQPAAPYYLAQTVVVQQTALKEAERRIVELEAKAKTPQAAARRGPWDRQDAGQGSGAGYGAGGGFLAGAAQTALGVAGGVMLGSFIGSMFSSGSAQAAESNDNANADDSSAGSNDADQGSDAGADDGGFDGGGDFGGDMGGDF